MRDSEQQALALMEKMSVGVPFTVYPDEELLRLARAKGEFLSANQTMTVEDMIYEEGEIVCAIQKSSEDPLYLCSVTDLIIPDDHPLVSEIRDYQNERKYRLALAEGKKGRAKRLARKVKKKKGFHL